MDTIQDFWKSYEVDQTDSLDTKRAGSVYTALDANGSEWAVKINEIHPNFDNGLLLERYTIAKTLKHRNLLDYKAAYRFAGNFYTNIAVMPRIEWGSLDNNWDLSIVDKASISQQIIEGLDYLHESEIIWQNLSAGHILLKKKAGKYKPLFINYGNKMPIPLAFFADYEYLAPEQFAPKIELSPQLDIWALGVLLYKIWTGRFPFGEKSATLPNAKIQQRILGAWEFGLIEKIPAPYQEIVKKCLCRKKEERWESCGQIIVAVNDWQKKGNSFENIKIDTASDEPIRRKILRKPNKPLVWWQVLFMILLAAVLGYWVNRL